MRKVIRKDIIYPGLSYKILGCCFEVFRTVGAGHREKYYENALKQEFLNRNIKYQSQVYYPGKYKGKIVGRNYLDFLIDDKVILELKVGAYFRKSYLDQVLDYLKYANLKLGIIATFTRNGVKSYRVVNLN